MSIRLTSWDLLEMVKKGSTTVLEENFGGYDSVIEIVNRLGNRSYVSYSYPNAVGGVGYIKDGKLCYDKPDPVEVSKGSEGLEMYGIPIDLRRSHPRAFESDRSGHVSPEVLRETREAAGPTRVRNQHSRRTPFDRN